MDHLDVPRLHEIIHETLAGPEREAADVHLSGCRVCRARLARERKWLRLLRLDEQAGASSEALNRALARVADMRSGVPRRYVAAIGVGALVAGLLIGAWYRASPFGGAAAGLPPPALLNQFDALLALDADPWVGDDLETIETLAAHGVRPEGQP